MRCHPHSLILFADRLTAVTAFPGLYSPDNYPGSFPMVKHPNLAQFFLLLVILAAACKKTEPEDIDLGYDYFPNTLRSFVIYQVDSAYYGINQQSFSFELKEVLATSFLDGEGQMAMVVERYVRENSADPWVLRQNWVQKITPTTAERVEDNIRFIRLVFPIEEGESWNGNAYNTLGEWSYTYDDVGKPFSIGGQVLDESLRVNQRNNVNLVDQEIAYEVYAKGVGLVKKYVKDITIQSGQTTGVEYTWTALQYGIEP